MGPAQWSTPCRGHAMWSLIFLCAVLFAARLGIINQKRYEREHTEEIGGMERTLALIKPHALEQVSGCSVREEGAIEFWHRA